MTIKQKIVAFITVIVAMTVYGTYIANSQKQDSSNSMKLLREWFNEWTAEAIEIRKTYHNKINFIPIVEIKSNSDYLDINKMKSYKRFLEQVLAVELWNMDSSLELSNKWCNSIEPKLKTALNTEQINYLKKYLKDGILAAQKFRQLTIEYTNAQFYFINYLLEKNCKLTVSDEPMYNSLASKVETTAKLYRDEVNYNYTNRMSKVKELNKQLKFDNVDELLDLLPDGIINEK